jgi:hypothetical protein
MMRSAEKTSKSTPQPPLPLTLVEAKIVVSLDTDSYLLNDGRAARQALSCLIRPEVGDHVLVATCQSDIPYILHILARNNLQQAQLSVPGVQQLCITQHQVLVSANDSIALNALTDIDINAATGLLSLNARNLFTSVSESFVQNVQHFVGQAEHYLLEVKQLLRLHGRQALITAEQDVKVDAERISMG